MKVYPTYDIKKQATSKYKKLSIAERITRMIALIVAFVTVYYFFFKILFF